MCLVRPQRPRQHTSLPCACRISDSLPLPDTQSHNRCSRLQSVLELAPMPIVICSCFVLRPSAYTAHTHCRPFPSHRIHCSYALPPVSAPPHTLLIRTATRSRPTAKSVAFERERKERKKKQKTENKNTSSFL
jgi:hypothetical protein